MFIPAAVTPIAVLRQQGEALGRHTYNFVHGYVETTSDKEGKRFTHTLFLAAPFLRYGQPLIQVDTGLQAYPATIRETDLTKGENLSWAHEVNNDQELQDRLREFFNEPRVKDIVRAVINMSNDVVPPEPGAG